jgi:hypothetical protein
MNKKLPNFRDKYSAPSTMINPEEGKTALAAA